MVSGERFMITMKLGVTDKTECAAAAKDRIVSLSDCSHEENEVELGEHSFCILDSQFLRN